MSISSPATDFAVNCYRSPADGVVWWYYSWKQNGRSRTSIESYPNRKAAMVALAAWRAETGE